MTRTQVFAVAPIALDVAAAIVHVLDADVRRAVYSAAAPVLPAAATW